MSYQPDDSTVGKSDDIEHYMESTSRLRAERDQLKAERDRLREALRHIEREPRLAEAIASETLASLEDKP